MIVGSIYFQTDGSFYLIEASEAQAICLMPYDSESLSQRFFLWQQDLGIDISDEWIHESYINKKNHDS
jgi:hypothetical protein